MGSLGAGDRYVTALENLAADAASLAPVNRMHLHFALAKVSEQFGNPEGAFRQLLAANTLKRQRVAYDEAATLGIMDRVRQVFTRDFIGAREGADAVCRPNLHCRHAAFGHDADRADIGKPSANIRGRRTHPVRANRRRHWTRDTDARYHFLTSCPDLTADQFRELGALYLEKLLVRAPGATRIVDKMPANFLYAGLIHLALPDAVIIHATRDPADTCVSCFSVHFTKGQLHTYDLAELGRYYRHYQALMAHWHSVLPPGRITDVRYEELVDDLEGVARRIVARCGLAWDPALPRLSPQRAAGPHRKRHASAPADLSEFGGTLAPIPELPWTVVCSPCWR